MEKKNERSMVVMMDFRDVIFSKVQPEPNSGCWLWAGAVCGSTGYAKGTGRNWRDGTKLMHRVSFEEFKGEIPKGLVIDHLCRVRSCINPDHLEPVSYSENNDRGGVYKINAGKTHCPSGHEYTEENTYVWFNKKTQKAHRHCRTCNLIATYRKRGLQR